jgi:hypothetical protein
VGRGEGLLPLMVANPWAVAVSRGADLTFSTPAQHLGDPCSADPSPACEGRPIAEHAGRK